MGFFRGIERGGMSPRTCWEGGTTQGGGETSLDPSLVMMKGGGGNAGACRKEGNQLVLRELSCLGEKKA